MLSVRDFWKDLSRRQFCLRPAGGLSEKLAYAALFDQLFGGLTRHRLVVLAPDRIVIDCLDCDHARSAPGNDVCETHIGIVQGQFERRFGCRAHTERLLAGTLCTLRVSLASGDHDER